jgi:long-subunit acyl-CoA synthetase (AMP-forming)
MLQERNGKIIEYSWKGYFNEVLSFAKSMHVLGVTERKGLNCMGHNAPEWTIAFMAGIMYDAISAGVYATN